MQTAMNPVNPALAQVIGAMDTINPVTPDGTPTVAAQVMQAAQQATMPQAAMPQIAQQAGLAGQIQAMQMQEAQKAMMQAAMRGQPQMQPQMPPQMPRQMPPQGPQGIEGLNPRMGNFAEGGIVGYAEAGMVSPEFGGDMVADESEPRVRVPGPRGDRMMTPSEMRAENYPEEYIRRRLEMEGLVSRPVAAPAAPPAAPAAAAPQVPPPAAQRRPLPPMPAGPVRLPGMSSDQLFERARAGIESLPREPVAPSQAIAPAIEAQKAMDEYRRQMGLPGEMERVSQQEAALKKLMGDREAILNRRMQEVQAQQDRGSLAQYLMGFRQMKGQSVGQGLMSGSQAAQAYESGLRAQFERIEDLKIDLQALSVEKQNALDKMRDDIAKGKFDDAMKRREQAQRADAEIKAKKAEIDIAQAKAVSQKEEAQYRAAQPGEMERLIARVQQLRASGNDAAADELLTLIERLRGAGQAGGRDINMQKLANQALEEYKKSLDYLRAKTPEERARLIEAKKKELVMQYPGAVFAQEQAAGPGGLTPEQRALIEKYTR